jgi:hypothetical protein
MNKPERKGPSKLRVNKPRPYNFSIVSELAGELVFAQLFEAVAETAL